MLRKVCTAGVLTFLASSTVSVQVGAPPRVRTRPAARGGFCASFPCSFYGVCSYGGGGRSSWTVGRSGEGGGLELQV